MSDPRVWIASEDYGGGEPQMIVTRPGYSVLGSVPFEGLAFWLGFNALGTLYLAGTTSWAAVAANGGIICSFADFGYVPIARAIFDDGSHLFNVSFVDSVMAYSDRLEAPGGGGGSGFVHYFVFTERVD